MWLISFLYASQNSSSSNNNLLLAISNSWLITHLTVLPTSSYAFYNTFSNTSHRCLCVYMCMHVYMSMFTEAGADIGYLLWLLSTLCVEAGSLTRTQTPCLTSLASSLLCPCYSLALPLCYETANMLLHLTVTSRSWGSERSSLHHVPSPLSTEPPPWPSSLIMTMNDTWFCIIFRTPIL